MGLLEKAMDYKSRLNGNGRTTIMDTIQGPAESGPAQDRPGPDKSEDDILYLQGGDLLEVSKTADGDVVPGEGEGGPLSVSDKEPRQAGDDRGGAGGGDGGVIPEEAKLKGETTKHAPADADDPENLPPAPSQSEGMGASVAFESDIMDYTILFEFARELAASREREDLFETMLFFVMGQIGVSSSSILVPMDGDESRWRLIEARGVTLENEEMSFDPESGILKILMDGKGILDIEDHKNDPSLKDDYFIFVSIDARLLVPLSCDDVVYGVIVLGNKISGDDFAPEELDYLTTVAGFSASVYRILVQKRALAREMEPLREGMEAVNAIEKMRSVLMTDGDLSLFRSVLDEYLGKYSLRRYVYFAADRDGSGYECAASDDEDILMIMESGLYVPAASALIRVLSQAKGPVSFDDYRTSPVLIESFEEKRLSRMSFIKAYPVSVHGSLLGFLVTYGTGDELFDEKHEAALYRLISGLMPLLSLRRTIDGMKDRYVDTVEPALSRIGAEMSRSAGVGIPLTLVVFSIKNFKRFHTLMGDEKTREMMKSMEGALCNRLSGNEFSVRFGRQKVLVVLPGKDKKYAVAFAGAVCNEMNSRFNSREVQLLITYLAAEYPIDGGGMHQLLNVLEM